MQETSFMSSFVSKSLWVTVTAFFLCGCATTTSRKDRKDRNTTLVTGATYYTTSKHAPFYLYPSFNDYNKPYLLLTKNDPMLLRAYNDRVARVKLTDGILGYVDIKLLDQRAKPLLAQTTTKPKKTPKSNPPDLPPTHPQGWDQKNADSSGSGGSTGSKKPARPSRSSRSNSSPGNPLSDDGTGADKKPGFIEGSLDDLEIQQIR